MPLIASMSLSFSAFILRRYNIPHDGLFQLWLQDVITDGLDQVQILATKSTRMIQWIDHLLAKYLTIWFLRLNNCMRKYFSFFHAVKISICAQFLCCVVVWYKLLQLHFAQLLTSWSFLTIFFFPISTLFFSAGNYRSYLRADLPPHFKSSVTEATVPESLLGKLQYVH